MVRLFSVAHRRIGRIPRLMSNDIKPSDRLIFTEGIMLDVWGSPANFMLLAKLGIPREKEVGT
jgi:hypothetical protein